MYFQDEDLKSPEDWYSNNPLDQIIVKEKQQNNKYKKDVEKDVVDSAINSSNNSTRNYSSNAPNGLLKKFSESPKTTHKQLRKVSCPVIRPSTPEHLEHSLGNLKKIDKVLLANTKTLSESKTKLRSLRHEFIKTAGSNKARETNNNRTNKEKFNEEVLINKENKENNMKNNIKNPKSHLKASKGEQKVNNKVKSPGMMKERSFSVDSIDPELDMVFDENNNEILDMNDVDNETSEQPFALITKISPSKKTLELNVKQFTQYRIGRISKTSDENNRITPLTLKPLELNFNFDKYRKKKAYTKKQVTKSLTNINGIMAEKEPIVEQMLATRKKQNNEDNRDNRGKDEPIIRTPIRMRRVHASTSVVPYMTIMER